ncbi:MAG: hypothetical protein KatS3mg110_3015 [Pirellulaceae bacterium]|nr:MAG: hypothetical protein KatS3mg110_3015 [Pirellulaceae bacterium]
MSSRKNPGSIACRRRIPSGQVASPPSVQRQRRPLLALRLPDLEPATRTGRFSMSRQPSDKEGSSQASEPVSAGQVAASRVSLSPTAESPRVHPHESNSSRQPTPISTRLPTVQRFTTAALIAIALFTVFVVWDRHRKLSEPLSRPHESGADTQRITHIDRDSFGTSTNPGALGTNGSSPDAYPDVAPAGAIESWPDSRLDQGRNDPRSSRSSVRQASFELAGTGFDRVGSAEPQASQSPSQTTPRHNSPEPPDTVVAREDTGSPAGRGVTASLDIVPAAQTTAAGIQPYEPRRLLPRIENDEHTP